MTIGGLQKTTLIDYPGKIAATVFLAGCNFRCPWCYSSELVLPEKIKKQSKLSEKEFFDFLKKRKELLEGVVLCGGEPTINKDLPEFIKKIKKLGYAVKIDTNGSNPKMLKKLIDNNLIDYVAMDIKVPLGLNFQFSIFNFQTKQPFRESASRPAKFQISKYKNEIKKSVDLLKNSEIDFEFRTTVVPTIHTKEDFLKIAKWIGGPKVKYYLQNFRPEKTLEPKFEKIKPYSEKYLLEIVKAISPFFEVCQAR